MWLIIPFRCHNWCFCGLKINVLQGPVLSIFIKFQIWQERLNLLMFFWCVQKFNAYAIHTWFWGVVCFLWSVNITCRIFPFYKLQIFGEKCIKCLFTLKSLRFGGAFDLSWEASGSYTVCICIVYHTIQLCTACKLGIMRFQSCTIQYHYCTALQDWKHKRKIPPSYESSSLGPYPQRFGISDL